MTVLAEDLARWALEIELRRDPELAGVAHGMRMAIALDLATPRGPRIPGFDRIGRLDAAGRRSLWLRLDYPTSPDPDWPVIELRAGREGDDAAVSIGPDNPAYRDLLNVLYAARFAAEWEDPLGQALEVERGEER